jgi:hypothetical protein
MNMVRYDIAIVGELSIAKGAFAVLGDDLPVEELPHFTVGSEFPVSSWVMWILNAPNAHLALPFFSRDCLSSAAEERAVKWAQLITAESHGLPPALDLKTRLIGM